MINSANATEFLESKLLTMDKYNSTPTAKLLPPTPVTQTRTIVQLSGLQNNHALDSYQEKQTQFLFNDQERVRVQHLEDHAKLQNNKCWNNFRTLYNISASSIYSGREVSQIHQTKEDNEIDINMEHSNSATLTPLHIENKSAFNLDFNEKDHNKYSICCNNSYNLKKDSPNTENNNNYKFNCKQYNKYGLINDRSPSMIFMSTESQPTAATKILSLRTEDQNKAYRHIESVHNYAKSNSYEGDDGGNTSPNGSRHSSYLDDDDDDDDDEEDNEDAEYDNDDDIDYEDNLESNIDEIAHNLCGDYKNIFNKGRCRRFQKMYGNGNNSTGAILELRNPTDFVNILNSHKTQFTKQNNSKIRGKNDDDEVQIDVDVETIESQSSHPIQVLDTDCLINNNIGDDSAASTKPDHHARRPMNAFLIFCKRHRAIVKERYKNLENRAITKILGDWWASLDTNDKKCFTNLAQQNKDAFFSANPNFKWYKLPAPPLRTLITRPANAFSQDYQEESEANALHIISNNTNYNNHGSYFKLADEAQMGDLSQLMENKSRSPKQCTDLQQVLGETSQFMSAHITGNSDALDKNNLKRRCCNNNSFSSNSSEEDVREPKKKSSRSCKGKRYQELINSGQIATALKKSKSLARPLGGSAGENSETYIKQNFVNCNNIGNNSINNGCQKISASEPENLTCDLLGFDLEERIKELPALNLDDYLQRKRNTKKKKKFSPNGKKRGQRNNTINNSNNNTTNTNNDEQSVKTEQPTYIGPLLSERLQQHQQLDKQHQHTVTAVGSQKRKARKESITRRDISAIEKEVASLLPLTINGCCYFQEAPTTIKCINTMEKDTEAKAAKPQSFNVTSTSPIIPLQQNSSSPVSVDILTNTNISNIMLNDNMSSSTSDLLILAEVAANRTELEH